MKQFLQICMFCCNLLFCVAAPSIHDFDYCKINCNNEKHTMCEYKAGGEEVCAGYEPGLTEEEKQVIVDIHNEFRQKVALGEEHPQPPASNMLELYWDEDIALVAQRWADQCNKEKHDSCRTNKKGEPLGQNVAERKLAGEGSTEYTTVNLTYNWYTTEVMYYQPEDVGSFHLYTDHKIGHYTQMVWAESNRVGCGAIVGDEDYYGNIVRRYRLVCNYMPAGNYKEHQVYNIGEACSRCPEGTKCSEKWRGLCAEEKRDVDEEDDKKEKEDKGKGSAFVCKPSLFIANFIGLILVFISW